MQSSSSLSPRQRARIAKQRELALALRRLRESSSDGWALSSCSQAQPHGTTNMANPSFSHPGSGQQHFLYAANTVSLCDQWVDAGIQRSDSFEHGRGGASPRQEGPRFPHQGSDEQGFLYGENTASWCNQRDIASSQRLGSFEDGHRSASLMQEVEAHGLHAETYPDNQGDQHFKTSSFGKTEQALDSPKETEDSPEPSSCRPSEGALPVLGSSHVPKGPLMFSKQQMEVLKAVAAGQSVFMTGSAGTGKSHILTHILNLLRKRLGKESVYVTASTGLAASTLGGTTLHSFSGIGLGTDSAETLAAKVLGKPEPRERWRQAKVLIIDEISMIDGDLFDKLDYVARKVRKNEEKCFGGLQLIVTGDFFQLPPVKPSNPNKYFAFDADCWKKCFNLQIELKHVFRQRDEGFVGMLNEIRKGSCSSHTHKQLMGCCRVLADDGSGITPTRLYPLKVDVKAENMNELKALAVGILKFTAYDNASSSVHARLLDGMRFEKEVDLCVGAQVMLLKNSDTRVGLVNGARGVVVGFESLTLKENARKQEALSISPLNKWPVVRFLCDGFERIVGPEKQTIEYGGVEVASRIQVPLILAWALSVHKCQGMTLDRVETNLSKAFEYGMVYVALSRVKSLDGLQLSGFDPSRIKVHPSVVLFYNKLTCSDLVEGARR